MGRRRDGTRDGIEAFHRVGSSSLGVGTKPDEPKQRHRSMLSRMLGSAMLGVTAVFATVAWLGEVEDAKPPRRLAAGDDALAEHTSRSAPGRTTPTPLPPTEHERLPSAPWTLEPGRIAGRLVDEDGSAVTNGRVPQSKALNDHERIRALEGELRRCGKDGKVTLSAKYVLDTGVLFQPVVRVTGSAAADPKVKECAQRLAERLRLLPRKAPSEFSSLTVSLE